MKIVKMNKQTLKCIFYCASDPSIWKKLVLEILFPSLQLIIVCSIFMLISTKLSILVSLNLSLVMVNYCSCSAVLLS